DLGEADVRPGAVVQRRDHGARPELRAVLADPPPDVLDPAVAQRRREQPRRLAALTILGREELCEAVAHGLGRPITLQALCACVPRTNGAVGLQEINRVVRYRLDQQPEVFVRELHLDWTLPRRRHACHAFAWNFVRQRLCAYARALARSAGLAGAG